MATTLRLSLLSLATSLGLLVMAGTADLLLAGPGRWRAPRFAPPPTVVVPPATLMHRLDGQYSRAGQPIDAPRVTVAIDRPLEIMRSQVTVSDYLRCVAAGACKDLNTPVGRGDLPMTGVNHSDATDYAVWLSRETGARWRLPKDIEWAHAAGSRFVDDARGRDGSESNPALRWLADYERAANRRASRDPKPRPTGGFGANEYGVQDMAGNVWEWTETCLRSVAVDAAGRALSETRNCGVYIVEGQHRAPMSFFMRNPRAGGCSVAAPPDNLGFRLVREPDWRDLLPVRLRTLLPA